MTLAFPPPAAGAATVAPIASLVTGAVALAVITALAVAAELGLRRLARRPADARRRRDGRQPSMTARSAQKLFERALYGVAPAAVAGGIAAARQEKVSVGAVVFAAMLVTGSVLWPSQWPLQLMPVARTVLRFLLPAAGMALALVPALFGDWVMTPSSAVPSLLGAWLIVAFGTWLKASFDAERPVRLAVIGSRELARKLAAELRQTNVREYVLVGHIGPEPEPEPDEGPERVLPWLGELEEVRLIVQTCGVDLLAVGPETPRLQVFEQTANACLDLPVRMLEASAFYEDVLGHVPIGQINSAWFQCIMHPRYSPTSPTSKRVLDLVVLALASVVAIPLLPFLALAVKLGDRGPVLYRQRRVGEQGREFEIVKLRTMRPDADRLTGVVPKADLITPVGRILRRMRFDELPQLWNVLKGEMTIVGPRPEQPQLVEGLSRVVPYYERRSLVRPGVTGWAQVRCGYAGSQVGTAWKICHDLFYVKRRSIVFDFLIILQTLHVLAERSEDELEAPAEDFILGEGNGVVTRSPVHTAR